MKPTSAFRPRFFLPAFAPVVVAPRVAPLSRALVRALTLAALGTLFTGCGVDDIADRRADRDDRRAERRADDAREEPGDAKKATPIATPTSAPTNFTLGWMNGIPESVGVDLSEGNPTTTLHYGYINLTNAPLSCVTTLSFLAHDGKGTERVTVTRSADLPSYYEKGSFRLEKFAIALPPDRVILSTIALEATCGGRKVEVGAIVQISENDIQVGGKPLFDVLTRNGVPLRP